MRKKKILIVSSNLNLGGVEKSLLSLLQSLDYSKYEIDLLLVSKQGVFFEFIPSQVNILTPPKYFDWILIPKKNVLSSIKSSIGLNLNVFKLLYCICMGVFTKNMGQARQKLWRLCKGSLPNIANKYDIAIDYNGKFKAFIVDKVNANKKLSWIHSDYKVYRNNKEIDIDDYGKVDAIISVSKTCQDIFNSEFPMYQHKNYHMPNIVSKEQVSMLSNNKVDFDNNFKGTKIIDITRLDPNKGLDIAIKACKKLLDSGEDIKWYIMGEGIERQNLEKLILKYNLVDRFILLGSRTNPYPYVKDADLVVHCSLFEGRSVAIDEAMLLAKPIILTNYPTAKDQIEHMVNGIICESSVDAVFKAVKLLIKDNDLRNRLTHNLTDYDIPVEKSIKVLESLI